MRKKTPLAILLLQPANLESFEKSEPKVFDSIWELNTEIFTAKNNALRVVFMKCMTIIDYVSLTAFDSMKSTTPKSQTFHINELYVYLLDGTRTGLNFVPRIHSIEQ